MKRFCGAGIFGGLVLVGLGGCSGAAQDTSDNTAPVAQEITLSASNSPAYVGATLRGSYRYADGDGDSESGTLKVWLRDGEPIEGADQDTYTATVQDSGKNLQYRVTPAAATGQSPGAAAVSSGITIENSAPTVTLSALVGAAAESATGVGSVLSVAFSYNDVDGDAADAAKIRWLRNESPIPNATGPSYTVTRTDLGSYLVAEVTPLALQGVLRGTAVRSPPVFIINSVPVAQKVELKAPPPVIIGSTLTASYTYFDADDDPEASSRFRWLRNGVAITGATGRNYTLTLADAGKTIGAEVTPLAQAGTLIGLPVSSSVAVASANVALTVSGAGLKQLRFSWAAVPGANLYKVSYNPDGVSGFVPVSSTSSTLTTTTYDWDISVHRINWPKAQFLLEACDASNTCLPSASVSALNVMVSAIGYFKASNTGANDYFGTSVALSADGNTLAVGAPGEASSSSGIGSTPNEAALGAGAVYVYTRSGITWTQQAYVKASNPGANDQFGFSLALSADGNTLAVGALGEASSSTGINSAPNEATPYAGAVYVYTRSGITWTQQAYVKASNTGAYGGSFGYSVALSADGNTLAVGALGEASSSTGIDSTPDELAPVAGAVYVYTRSGAAWSQQAYVKASNTGAYDWFGYSVALSADGNTLAVGASSEDSAATGIGGIQADGCAAIPATNCVQSSGAVYVYTRSRITWTQQAYVKASNIGIDDYFGTSVALSADGNTLAVGAYFEDSSSTGIGSTPNELFTYAGAVYVYTRSGVTWTQQAYVKASNPAPYDDFGWSVALSADGNTLAVGAFNEDSAKTGIIPGAPAETDTPDAALGTDFGAIYLFTRSGVTWTQQAYVKASNPGLGDNFGRSVALSADGTTLAVGASSEASAATGVNNTAPGQDDNMAPNAGAVYLY